jgi:hypothetical protein
MSVRFGSDQDVADAWPFREYQRDIRADIEYVHIPADRRQPTPTRLHISFTD